MISSFLSGLASLLSPGPSRAAPARGNSDDMWWRTSASSEWQVMETITGTTLGRGVPLTDPQRAAWTATCEQVLETAMHHRHATISQVTPLVAGLYAEIGLAPPEIVIARSPSEAVAMAAEDRRCQLSAQCGESLILQLLTPVIKTAMLEHRAQPLRSYRFMLTEMGRFRQRLSEQIDRVTAPSFGRFIRPDVDLYPHAIMTSAALPQLVWGMFAERHGWQFPDAVSRRMRLFHDMALACQMWWPYREVCIVAQGPVSTRWDGDGNLHSETGPALSYADGTRRYVWRGTQVPDFWIEKKKKACLTPELALANADPRRRRVACEIIGWEKILRHIPYYMIDDSGDPLIGQLVETDHPRLGRERFLRVRCGTGRQLALPVPPDMQTATQANAWTYGLDEAEFVRPEVRT